MEVETDFTIVKYRPAPGSDLKDAFVAKGDGLPRQSFYDVTLEGEFVNDEKYGPTFVVKRYATAVKRTRGNVLGFLAYGVIKGVGPHNAKAIVNHFGEDAIDIIEKQPERLLEVSGIGEKVLLDIKESFAESHAIHDLLLYVGQFYKGEDKKTGKPEKSPISKNKARRIVDHFGDKAVDVVKNDVYNLCEVQGFGFATVDDMALRMKMPMNTLPRVKACAEYVLQENRREGHLFMETDDYLDSLLSALNHKKATYTFQEADLRPLANQTLKTELIVYNKDSIYLKKDCINEIGAATLLARRLFADRNAGSVVPHPKLVDCGYPLAPEQEQAAIMALTRNTCIVTGGPGTGKTTIVRTILETYRKIHKEKDGILLCAPTGRAAKRMSEATGYPAFTVHKAFGLRSEDDKPNDTETKDLDMVILDEVSMADMWMFFMVLSRISPRTKLILVGDADQLPSVGPGNVLYELIHSEIVPLVQLEEVHRQAKGSTIDLNCKFIRLGQKKLIEDDDFVILPAKNQREAMVYICALYERAVKAHGKESVQILTPIRKDGHACGVNNLNTVIQKLVQGDPKEKGWKFYDRYYCEDDPVMQTKNANGFYNGDIGYVSDTSGDKVMVQFTGADKETDFDDETLSILDLAYSSTVHKAQGCEFPIIIIPVLKEHLFNLNRNLIYTGISRGKSRVFIVGNRWALGKAIEKTNTDKRRTYLGQRTKEIYYKFIEQEEGPYGKEMEREAV